MSKLIIGIHGLANKPEKSLQEQWWKESIAEGLRKNCGARTSATDIPLVAVYWASRLYKSPLHQDNNYDFDDQFDDEPYVQGPATFQTYNDGWLDSLRSRTLNVLGSALDLLRKHTDIDVVSSFLMAKIVRDLHFYYDPNRTLPANGQRRPAAEVLQGDLSAALRANAQHEIMLIAHSMGTIISYDVLRNLGAPDQGIRVPHFVTIGSPLGLPSVKDHIGVKRGKVRTPSIVTKSWTNFADRRDVVALDTHLSDDFDKNGADVKVKDDLVLNEYTNGKKGNPHKLYGYLRAPEVSKHIWAFLQG